MGKDDKKSNEDKLKAAMKRKAVSARTKGDGLKKIQKRIQDKKDKN